MLVYALACLKAGVDEVEVVYQFLERPEESVSATFTRSGRGGSREPSCRRRSRGFATGDFRPTPSEFACAGCPALDVVCAGPRLGGGRAMGAGARAHRGGVTSRRARRGSLRHPRQPAGARGGACRSPVRCGGGDRLRRGRAAWGRGKSNASSASCEVGARFLAGNCERQVLHPEERGWALVQRATQRGGTRAGRGLASDDRPRRRRARGRSVFCHATPRRDDEILTRITPEEAVEETCQAAPLVVVGHTHVQFDRVAGPTRLVNAGSVGMPYEGRAAAFWALLGPEVELAATDYDVERHRGPDPCERLSGCRRAGQDASRSHTVAA